MTNTTDKPVAMSKTDMVSVPRERLQAWQERFSKAQIFNESSEVQAILAQPADHSEQSLDMVSEQHRGEAVARVRQSPVKRYVSVELLKTRLQDGQLLYTHVHVCEKCGGVHCSKTVCFLEIAAERDTLRAQLAERDAQVDTLAAQVVERGVMLRQGLERMSYGTDDQVEWCTDVRALLNASAEPKVQP